MPKMYKFLLLLVLGGLTGCALTPTVNRPALQVGTLEQPIILSGVLPQDLRLGGVIQLKGDLLVPVNRRLEFAPGSQILVVGTDSTKIDPEFLDKGTEILVKGQILFAGEQNAPIRISLDAATPEGENWAGIELFNSQSAIFRYVDILAAETAILSIDSSLQLEEVNLLGSRYGLLLQGRGQLVYNRGQISGGDAGLVCFDQNTLNLQQVRIIDNLEEGLYLAAGCSLKQQGLQIARNDLGAVAPSGYRDLLGDALRSNRVNFHELVQGETSQ